MEEQQHYHPEPGTSLFQMNLDAQNSYHLRSSASWAKLLGVTGIILGLLFCILSAIAIGKLNSYKGSGYSYRRGTFDSMFGSSMAATRTGLWILVITGVIFIVGGIFSFNFGNKVNAALRSNDQQGLNSGFAALRNYYAIRSITLIVILLLFLISFGSAA